MGHQRPQGCAILARNMQREQKQEESNPKNQRCGLCHMRKSSCINVGYDDGSGWGNQLICSECFPMIFKKGKKDGSGTTR